MGLFDNLFSGSSAPKFIPRNEQEAWVAILYAVVASDGQVSDVERDKLGEVLVFKTLFNGSDIPGLYRRVMEAHDNEGSAALIDSAVPMISPEDGPTVFSNAVWLLLSDGNMGSEEKEIIEYLAPKLCSDEMASKVVEVMLALNKHNVIIRD